MKGGKREGSGILLDSKCYWTHHGNDSFLPLLLLAHHGIGFACSRLSISKDADVVALERVLQHLFADVIIHPVLRRKVGVFRLLPREMNSFNETIADLFYYYIGWWNKDETETHRCVWPVGIIKTEVLCWLLWGFGVGNSCEREKQLFKCLNQLETWTSAQKHDR